MNLLFITSGSCLNRGWNTGIENRAWRLAEKGYGVDIISGGFTPTQHNYSIPKRVTYHFTDKKEHNPFNFVDIFKKIVQYKQINFTIGWIHNISPIANLTNNNKIKFVANPGAMPPRSLFLSLVKLVTKQEISLKDSLLLFKEVSEAPKNIYKIISVSYAVQEACIKRYTLPPDKCNVIYTGIDTSFYSYRGIKNISNPPKILYVGRIAPGKGITDLINSLQYIKTPLSITLCGIGESRYIEFLQKKLNSFPIKHILDYQGSQPQTKLINYYHQCDIFTFLSHSEGLGKALLEAMGCGCPVVCSDINTFKEIVTHKNNGLLASTGSPKGIAEAINMYLKDPSLRQRCGRSARSTVEQYFSKNIETSMWSEFLNDAHQK